MQLSRAILSASVALGLVIGPGMPRVLAQAPQPPTLAQCQSRLAEAEKNLQTCKEVVDLGDKERANTARIIEDCQTLKAANTDLAAKTAEVQRLEEAKAAELQKSLELSRSSEAELKAALDDTNQKLVLCTEDAAKPWYGRWELYVGAVVGLAAGFAAGWVVGEL